MGISRLAWFARWHVARWMIHTAMRIAPAGPAQTLLVDHLNAYGRTVLAALKAKP
jgi:hypothetical protein